MYFLKTTYNIHKNQTGSEEVTLYYVHRKNITLKYNMNREVVLEDKKETVRTFGHKDS